MSSVNNSLLAILQLFAVMGVGWILGRRMRKQNPESDNFWNQLARFDYRVCVPALILCLFADFKWNNTYTTSVTALIVSMITIIVLTVVGTAVLPLAKDQKPTIASITFHSNCVFLGFPLIMAVVGTQIMPLVVLLTVVEIPMMMIPSIFILNKGTIKRDTTFQETIGVLRAMAKDPVVIGCVLGLMWSMTGFTTPEIVYKPLKMIGDIASPLALLIVGARMKITKLKTYKASLVFISIVNLLLMPLVTIVCAHIFGLGKQETLALTLFISMPVAVSTIVMIEQHKGNSELTANAITITTIASLFTSSGIVLMLA